MATPVTITCVKNVSFPVLGQALPIELANTHYVRGGRTVEGLGSLADARDWVDLNRDHLSIGRHDVDERCRTALVELRGPVREVLAARVEGRRPAAAALRALNDAAARRASHVRLRWTRTGPRAERRSASAGAAERLRADIAEATAWFVAGEDAARLRACPAPGCIGFFVKDHPRREWCSVACGNRARNARFHQRRHA